MKRSKIERAAIRAKSHSERAAERAKMADYSRHWRATHPGRRVRGGCRYPVPTRPKPPVCEICGSPGGKRGLPVEK